MYDTYYNRPAKCWEEALPIGNGSLGGIVYGGIQKEQIDLNDDTLWSGYPKNQSPKNTKESYQKAVELTLKGEIAQVQKLIEAELESGWTQTYLPMGALWVETKHEQAENYCRSLDFETATSKVEYTVDGTKYCRSAYSSFADKCMVLNWGADKKAAVSLKFSLTTQLKGDCTAVDDVLFLNGIAPSHAEPSYSDALAEPIVYEEQDDKKGMRFTVRAKIIATGGTKITGADFIEIKNSDKVTVIITSQTSFRDAFHHPYLNGLDEVALCAEKEQKALANFAELSKRHLEDYCSQYQRTVLTLPKNANSDLATDKRLAAFVTDKTDLELYALLFHFGRYLTLTCSRNGTQASTLQGIWNSELRPPWSSNYTLNINTEMNYWCTLPANLVECHEPLVSYIQALRVTGEQTANDMYGVDGFVAHHNSDIWLNSSPVGNHNEGSCRFAFWNMSAAWLCRNLVEQYEYTLDENYLREIYPTLKSAALFLKNTLVEHKGEYYLCPSTSPENTYLKNGDVCFVTKNATMSVAITQEIFENVIRFSKMLNKDSDFASELKEMLPKLHQNGIGSKGQLLEWDAEYDEKEKDHRHVSHLYGLYPASLITKAETPELAKACETSLNLRGDDGTGWSLGWKTCLWARLGDGNHALSMLKNQLRPVFTTEFDYSSGGGTYMNMFDAHPPMQIDGNFAATAAMSEMLLQNTKNGIHALPALPEEWFEGSVKGLRAKKCITVDIAWNTTNVKVVLTSEIDQSLEIKCFDKAKTVELKAGEETIVEFG